jgi:hypothetical protein
MTDSTATVEAEDKKRAVAKHALLAADGAVVEDFEDAHGIRYTDLASGLPYDFIPKNPNAIRMLAMFGARTLATNEASQVRQKDGSSQDQIDAIAARFAGMENDNVWVDRTREAGPRWDIPTLAKAAVNVSVTDGHIPATDAQLMADAEAQFIDLMNADKANVAHIRAVEGVEAEYKRLQGKVQKTSADLLGMLKPKAA